MIDFSTLQGVTIPEGAVTQIESGGVVLWKLETGKPIVLEVEKITSDTYAGETTYTGEQFILLDIYPRTNGAVSVTYGGLTKAITDASGAVEPNAQQVFFGTFNGVSDSVATPASGTLTIEGDYSGFGISTFSASSKGTSNCTCITSVGSFGSLKTVPPNAFKQCKKLTELTLPDDIISIGDYSINNTGIEHIDIPASVVSIGNAACFGVKTVNMLRATPPELVINSLSGAYQNFGTVGNSTFVLEKITVPKGCAATYKAAEGWSVYADYIVEAS